MAQKPKAKKAAAKKVKVEAKAKPKPKSKPKAKKAVVTTSQARFDRDAYELPHLDGGEAIALAEALHATKLTKPASVGEEALRMANALKKAKAVGTDAKAYDAAMDRAWSTFVRRIQDHAELPIDRHPEAALARQVYLVVRDLSILDLSFLAEFAQIGARLDSLRREGLLETAETLAGKAFLDEVLHCHAQYGEAIGVTEKTADRGEARHALVSAMREYVVQALAFARTEADVVAKALAPIVAFKDKQLGRLTERPHRAPPAHPPI